MERAANGDGRRRPNGYEWLLHPRKLQQWRRNFKLLYQKSNRTKIIQLDKWETYWKPKFFNYNNSYLSYSMRHANIQIVFLSDASWTGYVLDRCNYKCYKNYVVSIHGIANMHTHHSCSTKICKIDIVNHVQCRFDGCICVCIGLLTFAVYSHFIHLVLFYSMRTCCSQLTSD